MAKPDNPGQWSIFFNLNILVWLSPFITLTWYLPNHWVQAPPSKGKEMFVFMWTHTGFNMYTDTWFHSGHSALWEEVIWIAIFIPQVVGKPGSLSILPGMFGTAHKVGLMFPYPPSPFWLPLPASVKVSLPLRCCLLCPFPLPTCIESNIQFNPLSTISPKHHSPRSADAIDFPYRRESDWGAVLCCTVDYS